MRTWIAQGYFHGRTYLVILGVTDQLTIARLEQQAAQFRGLPAAY